MTEHKLNKENAALVRVQNAAKKQLDAVARFASETNEPNADKIRKIAEAFKSAISRAKIDSDGNLVIPSDRARRAS